MAMHPPVVASLLALSDNITASVFASLLAPSDDIMASDDVLVRYVCTMVRVEIVLPLWLEFRDVWGTFGTFTSYCGT